jgi:L-ascorbate metabolism protein UlaG (beta-lactamase superfamily)
MKFQQIRNATSIIDYAGKRFLIDPMLADKESFPGFPGTMNSHLSNPLVELPIPMDEILDVDAVIVTHTHQDHWDDAAKSWVPKDMFIFAQNEKDAEEIHSAGFDNVHVLENINNFGDIKLFKTSGQHGNEKAMAVMGDILGCVWCCFFAPRRENAIPCR